MLFTLAFWLVILVDVAALGLVFLLGLAAGPPSHTALFDAVNAQNWPAVTLLLDRGIDWRAYRDLQDRDLKARLESDARLDFTDRAAVAGVLARLR